MKLEKKKNLVDTVSLEGLDDVFQDVVVEKDAPKEKKAKKAEEFVELDKKQKDKAEKNKDKSDKKDKKAKKKEEKNKRDEVKELVGKILTGPKRKMEAARTKAATAKARNYILPLPEELAKKSPEPSLRDRITETIECTRKVMKPIAEVNLHAIETQYKVQIQSLQDSLHALHAKFQRFETREREYMELELAFRDTERAYEQRERESEMREFARMERDRENQERIMFLESQVDALQATLISNRVLRERMQEMEAELAYHRRGFFEKLVDWLFTSKPRH